MSNNKMNFKNVYSYMRKYPDMDRHEWNLKISFQVKEAKSKIYNLMYIKHPDWINL